MTHGEREAAFLPKLARLRQRADDLAEELSEAGLEKTALSIRLVSTAIVATQQSLMSAIRKADDK